MKNPAESLTQDEVRGLFTHSGNHGATITFSREFPNVVCVLNRFGSCFDVNFSNSLQRFVQICEENGVRLDMAACRPVKAVDLEPARELEEAVDRHVEAMEAGKAPVETEISVESTDRVQELARESKKQSKKKGAA